MEIEYDQKGVKGTSRYRRSANLLGLLVRISQLPRLARQRLELSARLYQKAPQAPPFHKGNQRKAQRPNLTLNLSPASRGD